MSPIAFGGRHLVALATAVSIGVSLGVVPSSANAERSRSYDAPESVDRAQQLVNSAQVLYDEGKYEPAAEAYKAAYDLVGNPLLLFNIAVCYDRLNRFEEALDYLDKYAMHAPESERPELERRRKSLQARRESMQRRTPADDPSAATEEAEDTPTPTDAPTASDSDTAKPPIFGVAGGVLTGLTVTALGLGIGFGAASLQQREQARDACAGGDDGLVCLDSADTFQSRQRTFGIVADVSFGVAAATGIALIAVLSVRAAKRRRSNTAWSPSFGNGQAGFTVLHRF